MRTIITCLSFTLLSLMTMPDNAASLYAPNLTHPIFGSANQPNFTIDEEFNTLLTAGQPLLDYVIVSPSNSDDVDLLNVGYFTIEELDEPTVVVHVKTLNLDQQNSYTLNFEGDHLINFTLPNPNHQVGTHKDLGYIVIPKHGKKSLIEQATNLSTIHEANHISLKNGHIILEEKTHHRTHLSIGRHEAKQILHAIYTRIKPHALGKINIGGQTE